MDQQDSWAWGLPLLFGLLLGGMEWSISASLYNAFGIGAAAYALAQIAFGFWVPKLTQSLRRVQELTDKHEQLEQLNKNLQAELKTFTHEEDFKKKENTKLKQEVREVREECERLREQNSELRNQRDWQIRLRCRKLADGLDKLLDGWERDDPKNREAMCEYNNQFKADVARELNALKQFDLWKPKVDYPEMLENPETRKDVDDLAGYLRWVANGFPI